MFIPLLRMIPDDFVICWSYLYCLHQFSPCLGLTFLWYCELSSEVLLLVGAAEAAVQDSTSGWMNVLRNGRRLLKVF